MIVTIAGTVTHKLADSLVLETGGVGYEIWMTPADMETVYIDQTLHVWVYDHVREDARDLYGFFASQQRDLFVKLLGVSGVGPKAALAILAVGSFQEVSHAISSGDVALLQSAPGIGKRTAERISIDLKSDAAAVATFDPDRVPTAATDTTYEALVSLGYSQAAANQALARVSRDLSDEERLREALKEVS